MASSRKDLLRALPSVSAMLDHEQVRRWLEETGRSAVVTAVQDAIEAARRDILEGDTDKKVGIDDLLPMAEAELVKWITPSLGAVINATGVVLHTGLGRSPLCESAMDAVAVGAGGYCNLEYDLETGERGRRVSHVVDRLVKITGTQSATVVNNNAAATLLILRTFASGKEVVVSRGQLIEIGGSFRLPDIMRAGGCILREVGTTNRTRLSDFEAAVCDETAILMHVHTSNFRVVGFTESVPIETIVELAHRYDLLAVDDLGSGAIYDFTRCGLPEEPYVRHSLAAGADLVCFSGDKLLGGPQCGIIVGKGDLIARLESDPLMRTYRVGKLTLLALEATLAHYLDPEEAVANIPTLRMLAASTDELARRARALCEQLEATLPGESFFVCSDVTFAGGGSIPGKEMQTIVVQWRPARSSTGEMAAALRTSETRVIVRIRDDAICFDLRTIPQSEFELLVESVSATAREFTEDLGTE